MRKQDLRERKLLGLLRIEGRLGLASVTKELGVSEATARRLFAKLEAEGKLLRVHGGVQEAPLARGEYSFRSSELSNARGKEAVGRAAAELVESGERIFLDAGATVLRMAEKLSLRIRIGELKDVRVATNSLCLVDALAEVCEVELLGGRVRPGRRDVCGALTRQGLERLHFDKAFLGVDAVSPQGELMAADSETAEIDGLFLRRAKQSFALADSEKFGRGSMIVFAKLSDVSALVTDCPRGKLPKSAGSACKVIRAGG